MPKDKNSQWSKFSKEWLIMIKELNNTLKLWKRKEQRFNTLFKLSMNKSNRLVSKIKSKIKESKIKFKICMLKRNPDKIKLIK